MITPPQTPAKDQGGVGFCWAYSLAGQIEQKILDEKGIAIDISEEYLAFYSMYRQLYRLIPFFIQIAASKTPASLIDPILTNDSVNWFLTSFAGPQEGIPDFSMVLRELDARGIVPEYVYKMKFPEGGKGAQKRIGEFFSSKFLNSERLREYLEDPELLRNDLGDAFGKTPPRETDEFEFGGEKYTALTFMREFADYEPNDYEVIRVDENNHHRELLHLRMLLARRISVPFAFAVMEDVEWGRMVGLFDPMFCQEEPCRYSGWHHAVLAVNFSVKLPFLSDQLMLSSSYDRKFQHPLDSVLIKNSWGNTGRDSGGLMSCESENQAGYYEVTDAYLKAGFQKKKTWSMVVPKDQKLPEFAF